MTAEIPAPAVKIPGWLRTMCLALAACLFVAGFCISIRISPLDPRAMRLAPLLFLTLALTPLQVVLNAREFVVSSRMQSASFSTLQSFRITVTASLANYLPLPAAMIAKVAALRLRGVAVARGAAYTFFSFFVLACMAFVYAGFWIWILGLRNLAIFHAVAAVSILAIIAMFCRHQKLALRDIRALFFNRLFTVALDGARIHFALLALGGGAQFAQTAALSTSGMLGLAVPIVPAGLGVKELVSALIGPLVGMSGAAVFLAASLIRLIDLSVLSVSFLLLYRKSGGNQLGKEVPGA